MRRIRSTPLASLPLQTPGAPRGEIYGKLHAASPRATNIWCRPGKYFMNVRTNHKPDLVLHRRVRTLRAGRYFIMVTQVEFVSLICEELVRFGVLMELLAGRPPACGFLRNTFNKGKGGTVSVSANIMNNSRRPHKVSGAEM